MVAVSHLAYPPRQRAEQGYMRPFHLSQEDTSQCMVIAGYGTLGHELFYLQTLRHYIWSEDTLEFISAISL